MKMPETDDEKEKRWKMLWIVFTVLALVQSAALFVFTLSMPDRVPLHFGLSMKPDRWGSPRELWIISLITPLLFIARPVIDRKFSQDPRNQKIEDFILLFIGSFISCLSWWLAALASRPAETLTYDALKYIPFFIHVMVGLFTVVIGNYEGTIKPNRTLGIKTKWALEDAENWRKTHRFAAPLAVAAGIILMAGGTLVLLTSSIVWYPVTGVLYILLVAVLPVVHSYRLHRRTV
jgi:uncharacterized membrane protein